jgi:cation diffusion facilitator CzcD-associated flavoprotein CzcO
VNAIAETTPADLPSTTTVLIIGAGPGGLGAGIALDRAGVTDFIVVEKASGVGGTWYHNRYPGAECDVETHLYSYSFEPKLDWSKPYAGQREIKAYIEHVAQKYGMLPHCRFQTEVASARWDETGGVWEVTMVDGRLVTARFMISAIGMFNEIVLPDVAGLDEFAGEMFHTARWPENCDLTGKRVALVGSAASAVQTAPEIAPFVGQLDIYQRTPQWVMAKRDTPFTQAELDDFRAHPELVEAHRRELWARLESAVLFDDPQMVAEMEAGARRNLETVEDPELRRRLTPDWGMGCRRPLASNKYYPIFNQSNVHLVDKAIARVTTDGLVTSDGEFRAADVIILATGFQTTRYLAALDVTGRDGVHIRDAWSDGAIAYHGITTPGFPNLFMLYGPNTNNNSLITMLELQAGYAVTWIKRMLEEDVRWLDVKTSASEVYNAKLQSDIARITVWRSDCGGYYRAPSGRIVTQFPYTMTRYAEALAAADHESYLLT